MEKRKYTPPEVHSEQIYFEEIKDNPIVHSADLADGKKLFKKRERSPDKTEGRRGILEFLIENGVNVEIPFHSNNKKETVYLGVGDYNFDDLNEDEFFENRWEIVHNAIKEIHKMHSLGVVHGDLNTGNIIFDKNGKTSLIDFEYVSLTENSTPLIENEKIQLELAKLCFELIERHILKEVEELKKLLEIISKEYNLDSKNSKHLEFMRKIKAHIASFIRSADQFGKFE